MAQKITIGFKIMVVLFIGLLSLIMFTFVDTTYENERKILSVISATSCENINSDYVAEEVKQSNINAEILDYAIITEINTQRCSYETIYIQHQTPNIYQVISTDVTWFKDCSYFSALEHIINKQEGTIDYNYIIHEEYGFMCIIRANYYVER